MKTASPRPAGSSRLGLCTAAPAAPAEMLPPTPDTLTQAELAYTEQAGSPEKQQQQQQP